MFNLRSIAVSLLFLLGSIQLASACGSCGSNLANLGKDNTVVQSETANQKVYFQYLFNQTHWDKMDAREAHNIHHSGHEFHDKTTEDFHHFQLGARLSDRLSISLDMPYVVRRSLEVESHAFLGKKQTSQGWGDLQAIGTYKLWQKDVQSFSGVAGMQFPTGGTKEKNTQGVRFEPELQPGSGAYDYILGGLYNTSFSRSQLAANATYVITTRGAQEFEAGDILTLSADYDYFINPSSKNFKTSLGLDSVYQYEQEDKTDGVKSIDSGGHLILAGPIVKVETGKHLSIVGSVLFPVYQQLGGVHQELAYEWTLSALVKW